MLAGLAEPSTAGAGGRPAVLMNRLRSGLVTVAKDATPLPYAELIDALASGFEPRLRAAFIDAASKLADRVKIEALAQAVTNGDTAQALALLGLAPGQVAFGNMTAILVEAAAAAAKLTLTTVPITSASVSFDLLNPFTVEHLRTYAFNLITKLTDEVRQGVAEAIRAGVTAGQGPYKVAREIRAVAGFGLTAQQARAVANFRAELESLDAQKLAAMLAKDSGLRVLRDRRFDPAIKAALSGKAPLTQAKIDQMVERYRQRQLKFRADMIARTEALRAANIGAHEAMRQAVENGSIPDGAIVRRWVVAKDERTCPQCKEVPRRNKAGVGLRQPFDTPYGPRLLPPLHTLCRCVCVHRISPRAIEAATIKPAA